MKREYYKQHSDVLGEDMSMLVYGEGGYPVIAFQAQDAKSNNFEDFGMIDVLAPYIEDGRIQVFSVDNLDEESWSDEGGDKAARAWRQEEYFKFVTDELIPRVHAWNNSDLRPIAVGCSMGATHAAIAAFRRPDLFQGCIALSGVYRTSFFFGDWMDENLYNNDVPAFLTNMPADHPYVRLYNERQLVMCVGQGAWEMGIDDLHYIDAQLNRLGVEHWCDFWGTDVNHDWPWWRKQMPYFMNEVLSEIEDKQAFVELEQSEQAKAEEPKAEEPKAEPVKAEEAKPAAKKPAAKKATTTRKAPAKKAATTETATVKAEATEAEAPAAKPAAKRTTTRKAATTKTAAAKDETAKAEAPAAKPVAKKAATTKAAAAKAEAVATEAPAAKPTATKTAAKKATATKAAAAKATETAETAEAEAPAAKPAAKRTTTRKAATKTTSTKAATAKATETAEAEAPAKKAPAKRATRRTTKMADAAE